MGDMSDYILDSIGEEPLYDYGGTKTCRCCKQENLYWAQRDDGKFILVDQNNRLHICPVNPLNS